MTSNLRAVFNNSVFPFDFPNFSLMLEVVQVPVVVAAPPPPQCLDNSPKLIFAAPVGGGWWLHHCLLPSVNTAAGGPAQVLLLILHFLCTLYAFNHFTGDIDIWLILLTVAQGGHKLFPLSQNC